MGDVVKRTCNACGAVSHGHSEEFTLPTSVQERADERADRDELVAEANHIELYNSSVTDDEHLTLIRNRRRDTPTDIGSVTTSTVRELTRQLVDHDGLDTGLLFRQVVEGASNLEPLVDGLSGIDRVALFLHVLPDGLRVTADEEALLDSLSDAGVRQLMQVFD
jgi:hypothetical protein